MKTTRKRSRRLWVGSLLAALCLAASLAACSAADPPRGGPQLPSTPSFLGGSGSDSPSPSGALPALPVVGGLPVPTGLMPGASPGL